MAVYLINRSDFYFIPLNDASSKGLTTVTCFSEETSTSTYSFEIFVSIMTVCLPIVSITTIQYESMFKKFVDSS